MFQIVCPECNNATKFEKLEKKPTECSFCFATFSNDVTIEEIEDDRGTLVGLELIYQKTLQKILVKGEFNLLGRQNTGDDVLSAIIVNGSPVISRKHCSISLIEGKYYLKDEGSTNGTYYGLSRKDCSGKAYEIENDSMLFLGQEAFLVKHLYDKKEQECCKETPEMNKLQKPKKYRCNEGCGYESEVYSEICPNCMTSNSLVEIV